MKNLLLSGVLILLVFNSVAQAPKRTMPRNINMRGYNSYYPAISGDGNSMVYLSNFTNDESVAMMYTYKISASSWKDPEEMPNTFNLSHLTYNGGYSLNFDGSRIYFTYRKSGGMGGYDIWYSDRNSTGWGGAQNLGNPVNSSTNEGMPSVSADGQYLYFTRCESMSNESAEGCQIFVSKSRGGSLWDSPEALPSNINNGGAYSPKILADGETLIFSSDRAGGKGGKDLYLTRKEGDIWTDPKRMDFVNTSDDDQFVSIAAKGRYIYHDINAERGKEIELLLIPDEFKAKNTLRVIGMANFESSNQVTPSYVKVYNLDTKERIFYYEIGPNDKGEFNFVIKEGSTYDLSIEPKDSSIPYYSKLYDLREMRNSTRDELEVMIKSLNTGDSILLDAIFFENNDINISSHSTYELRRLTRFIKNNSSTNFEIGVILDGFRYDSTQSDPMLTEVIADTVYIEMAELQADTLYVQVADSLEVLESDTTNVGDKYLPEESVQVGTDQVVEEEIVEEPEYMIKYTYHNDRTIAQSEALSSYLQENDIDENHVKVIPSRRNATDDQLNAKVQVYLKKIN